MSHFTIYHNPKCSKSREALALLHRHHIQPIVIKYLKNPLSLEHIIKLRSHFNLKDFVRCNELIFKELKLSLDDEDAILHAMTEIPILMQRPIVTYDEHAVIGRLIENVLSLMNRFSQGHDSE